MNWLRLYTDILDNPKIQALSPILFKTWANLICVARLYDGVIPSVEIGAFRLRITRKMMASHIEQLVALKLLEQQEDQSFKPHDWDEHQYVSDDVNERVKKHRAKRVCNVTRNVTETVNATPSDTDQIRDREEVSSAASVEAPVVIAIPTPIEQQQQQMPPLACIGEYPKTLSACRAHDPGVDDLFVLRLVQAVIQGAISHHVTNGKLEKINDRAISKAVEESYATGPPTHRAGLLLNRVPSIIVSWCQEDN